MATKEELSNSNRSIENEIQRATAKENEILDSLNTNKTIWDNKYTREEIDDKFDNIVIPTKISDLENDSNLGSITGIKGNNEAEYRNTGNINITADNIGAAKVIQLYGTSGNVINLDTLTDFGLYKINNNDTIMWVTYNGGNSQIDCRYMELFVGGNDKFKYQIIFPLDYYNKFRMRSITINEDETTEFSEWSEIATLNDLISYIDAQYVKNSQILNTKEQIDANTSTKSIAGALAVKEIKNELTNDINQINSNLDNSCAKSKSGYLVVNQSATFELEPYTSYLMICGFGVYSIQSYSKTAEVFELKNFTGADVSATGLNITVMNIYTKNFYISMVELKNNNFDFGVDGV